jgi:shikimate dehydrogenase
VSTDRPGARSEVWPRPATHIAGVIGDPVRHSLSPALHNAAFTAAGLDWVYVAFDVREGTVPAALNGMRALAIDGLSVTMPHKAPAAATVDRLSPVGKKLGAINTVTRRGRELLGDSTDGEGFLAALRQDEGWDPAGRRIVVLGTGGVARAVCLALAQAGAASVGVVGRRAKMAKATAGLAGGVGRVAAIGEVGEADLVVNATPVGMAGVVNLDRSPPGPALPFELDPDRLGSGQHVIDLIYTPAVTPLMEAARSRGAQATNGLGMLIHQAALQFRIWTGEEAPLEVMSAAAVAALSHRG